MFYLNYRYAYLIGDLLICFPVWLLLFLRRRDLGKEILLASVICALLGPISEFWYLRDYWHPQTITGTGFGIEDVLFGFFIGGIGVSLYEEVFGERFAKRADRKHHWTWLLLPFTGLGLLVLNGLNLYLGINSIYASSIMFFVLALTMLWFRRDLCIDAFVSGILLTLFGFLAYRGLLTVFPELIFRWWKLENISGVLLSGIPAEELLWAFTFGLVAGPAYEFFAGLKLKNLKK
ncbi:lycopene cyclase domain-containing protein [Patescibacteria group bacterium]|nr:lycopene cyclase domain-containing protein [Patescibacteria group bacterium]